MIIGISGKALSGKDTVANIIQWLILKEEKNVEIAFEDFEKYSKASDWKNVKFADKLKDMVCLLLGCTRKQLEDPKFKETTLGEEWWYWKNKQSNNTMLIPYEEKLINHELIKECYYLIKPTPRLILQLLGTDCGRQIIHPDIWVNATMSEYKPQHFRTVKIDGVFSHQELIYPKWIISDVRFPNELKAVKGKGGITIRVNRDTEYLKCIEDPAYFVETYMKVNNEKIELREYEKDFIKKHCKPTKEHESETALDNAEFDYVIDNNGTIEELIQKVKEILIKEKLL